MTSKVIPPLDLSPEIKEHWEEYNSAFQDVLKSGQFIMGPAVRAFEDNVADYLKVEHAIGVNSGTDALVIGLRAIGVGTDDEVITTPFTFFATAEAISSVGAKPVFVDVDPYTFNINPQLIEKKITPKTKAILPVHLYGQGASMDSIVEIATKHNLKILEDTAQAFGGEYKSRKLGTIGDAGAFSFFPSKNLGGFGDGGLIVTNNDDVAETARMLRVHGARKKYHNELIGYNSRLDAIQAALLDVKLKYIDRDNELRQLAASRYSEMLCKHKSIEIPFISADVKHVFHQYTIKILNGDRNQVKEYLATNRIQTMIYYPVPMNQLPVYENDIKGLPISDGLAEQILSLPIWPTIDIETQKTVVQKLQEVI